MKQSTLASAISATLLGASVFVGSAQAAPRLCDDGSRPPCQDTGEAAANNLSYPVIWSDDTPLLTPLPSDDWTFGTVSDPASECYTDGTNGVPLAEAVCYFDSADTWWLQQREANKWQAFNPSASQPLVVTDIDWSDDLESRTNFNVRSVIRTEVVLLKDVTNDAEFGADIDSFEAFRMRIVPGTENSPDESQGTDYPINGLYPSDSEDGAQPGYHATVYSGCARFIIQKVVGDPSVLQWSPVDGYWGPVSAVNNPVFNEPVYDSVDGQGGYSAEINVGGKLIYGYNWNLRRVGEGAGLYRLTYVLDGDRCPATLNTSFDGDTQVVNLGGSATAPQVVPVDDAALSGGSEGGLTYIDVTINASGGGGGKK